MAELKFSSYTSVDKKIFLVSMDSPLKVVQDLLIKEGQRIYGHFANGMLSELNNDYEDWIYNDNFNADALFSEENADLMNAIGLELGFKTNEPFDNLNQFILEEIFTFFYTYFLSKRNSPEGIFDTKDNRVEISELLMNYNGEAQEAPLKMIFTLNEWFEDLQVDYPEFSKLLNRLGVFQFLKEHLKELQADYTPFKLRISPEEVIVHI